MKRTINLVLYVVTCISCVNKKTPVDLIPTEVTNHLETELDISKFEDQAISLNEEIYACDKGEIYAYLIDDDSNGTNIRNSPNGKIIYVLRTQYGNVDFTISESFNGWFKISEIGTYDDEIEPLPDDCWIHGSLLAADTRNYGGQSIPLYKTPDTTKAIDIINEELVGLSFNDMCGSDWVQVRYDGNLVWIRSKWLCGNPVTTCN